MGSSTDEDGCRTSSADDHHHSSLALFTPADVFFGRVPVVAAVRQLALGAYDAHPERFTHGAPRVPLPPAAVHINPLAADALLVLPSASAVHAAPPPAPVINTRSQRLAALRRPALCASIAT